MVRLLIEIMYNDGYMGSGAALKFSVEKHGDFHHITSCATTDAVGFRISNS